MKFSFLIFCLCTSCILCAQTSNVSVEFNATAENEIAIYGVSSNDLLVRTYGVYGQSNATDGVGTYGSGRTGVLGIGGDYGIYGVGTFRAGYFSGDLEYTGAIHGAPSDLKLKNILPKKGAMLDRINSLRIEKYTYKQSDFEQLHLSGGIQYGFIAQNLEKTFPNLVNDSKSPSYYDLEQDVLVESIEYKTVNYIGMIPILTEGIKELNGKLEAQDKLIKSLLNEISQLKDQ